MLNKLKKLFNKHNHNIWLFFFTQSIVPFETAIAFYCMWQGLAGILKIGIVSNNFVTALGETMALLFNIWYAIAGICLYFGIGLRRRDIEVVGLMSIITSLLIRMAAIGVLNGLNYSIFSLYVVNTAFIVACLVRMRTLFKYTFYLKVIDKRKTIEGVGILNDGY